MHIERLDQNKLKIVLSDMDFEDFSVTKKQLVMDRDILRSFILKLMDTISEETDFNPYNGNIVIEAKEQDGGMSIIVSKAPISRKYTKEELKKATHINATVKDKPKVHKGVMHNIYTFKSFEDVCVALHLVDDYVHNASSLYKYNNTYCYLTKIDNTVYDNDKAMCKALGVFNEYCDYSQTSIIKTNHIKEHGELIAEGKKLISMAEGVRNINILWNI